MVKKAFFICYIPLPLRQINLNQNENKIVGRVIDYSPGNRNLM